MPRRILATVVETYCPNDGAYINLRLEEGQADHWVNCWNCNERIYAHNGYGERNIQVFTLDEKEKRHPLRFTYVWQQRP